MKSELLHPLHVLPEFGIELIGQEVNILAIYQVFLPVEEPGGDLELGRILDDRDAVANLTSSAALFLPTDTENNSSKLTFVRAHQS